MSSTPSLARSQTCAPQATTGPETLDSDTTAINATTAFHAAEFSRRRADGSEIARLRAAYLITLGAHGWRISALAVHGA